MDWNRWIATMAALAMIQGILQRIMTDQRMSMYGQWVLRLIMLSYLLKPLDLVMQWLRGR